MLTGSLAVLVLAAASGCGPRLEDEPPIPEHRLEPCHTRCEMLFDPGCALQDVEVPTEEECFDGCIASDGLWVPIDGQDQCAATEIAYIECVAALPCEERQRHVAFINELPRDDTGSRDATGTTTSGETGETMGSVVSRG